MKPLKLSLPTRKLLQQALCEDVGPGDITSDLLVPASARGQAKIIAREAGIFCGGEAAAFLCRAASAKIRVRFRVGKGAAFKKNHTVMILEGDVRGILRAERTVLNLLGHLCGIATRTHELVRRVKPYGVKVLDTRKTLPLWRELEKDAVRAGGGYNHRFGLYDEVFVKENHRPYGRLRQLMRLPRRFVLEVRNDAEIRQAFFLKPRVILLDNFSPARLRKAVRWIKSQDPYVLCESSGGITAANAAVFARTGIDQVSSGAITHSAASVNFSLLLNRGNLKEIR